MLENIPSQSTMTELLGQSLFDVWKALCSMIEEKYDIEPCLLYTSNPADCGGGLPTGVPIEQTGCGHPGYAVRQGG